MGKQNPKIHNVKPKIGITIGDQNGIGPEIIKKALFHDDIIGSADFQIIGEVLPSDLIHYGRIDKVCGRIAGEAIKEAVSMALNGDIDAIVTAPIHKEALNLGGFNYPGHTEMLAHLTHTENYAMMLVHKNLRVVHVTTHQSLKKAIDSINVQKIFKTIKVARQGCMDLGIRNPRIAVAALNPHAGDGGLFGDEERDVIQPSINLSDSFGYNVFPKPLASDVVFAKALGGSFDCVVAMYHDQGHIPIKTVGFKWDGEEWENVDGVNVTLGLPIIRTSPDHGVAFGKSGKGLADPTSMISAIKLALELIKNRRGSER